MKLFGKRVLVSRIEKEKKEGFETVDVQDDFIYKGKVEMIGERLNMEQWPMYTTGSGTIVGTSGASTAPARRSIEVGDTIIFAKYSPDTHEVEHDGKKYKSVVFDDIIAVL